MSSLFQDVSGEKQALTTEIREREWKYITPKNKKNRLVLYCIHLACILAMYHLIMHTENLCALFPAWILPEPIDLAAYLRTYPFQLLFCSPHGWFTMGGLQSGYKIPVILKCYSWYSPFLGKLYWLHLAVKWSKYTFYMSFFLFLNSEFV